MVSNPNTIRRDVAEISVRCSWELVCSVCREGCGGVVSATVRKREPMQIESTAAASAAEDDTDAQAERLQGERFLQLSQRCHEQNWAQVHALAEQILLHRRKPKEDEAAKNDDGHLKYKQGSRGGRVEVAGCPGGNQTKENAHDGSQTGMDINKNGVQRNSNNVPTSGEVIDIDGQYSSYENTKINDLDDSYADDQEVIPIANGEGTDDVDAIIGRNRAETPPVSKPPHAPHSSTPRMLSTCLGTASPLAWTCRYSAPSLTVKLVLDLDPSSVRRCLPQLGTPLHECVGRPRPLQKMPLKRGAWSNIIGIGINSGEAPTSTPRKKRMSSKKEKKKKKQSHAPPILAGLRKWRRTVRALVRADETLMKEDAKSADAAERRADKVKVADAAAKEWRSAVQSMIKGVGANIKKFEVVANGEEVVVDMPGEIQISAEETKEPVPKTINVTTGERHCSLRATLAQDADGNTPLHFMIRGAATPAFNGGRWQDLEVEEDENDEDDSDESVREGDMDIDDETGRKSIEDSLAGENYPETTVGTTNRSLRRFEYWGTNGSSWDGIRWCMEAHIRRVERRTARQLRWKREMNECNDDNIDGDRGVARCVASVRIGSPIFGGEKKVLDLENDDMNLVAVSSEIKLPAKRKSSVLREESVKARGKATDPTKSNDMSRARGQHKSMASRDKKYFDDDEYQDCKYFDPLLGCVCDLVHSCPEAVGIPDHREYSETPLIVALKSSIYVMMEPDNEFQLVERIAGAEFALLQPPGGMGGGLGGRAVGDGFAIFGGGLLNGGARGFPFPNLRALMHNQPFQDDGAMMAVLRGHGRRVTREIRRTNSASLTTTSRHVNAAADIFYGRREREESGDAQKEEVVERDNCDEDDCSCSTISDDSTFDGEDDPRYDAFADEQMIFFGVESPRVQLGLIPRRRPRYDYQTALEYRIFCLVRIMLESYPRAACLMISDYSPLHSAVFHGRCPDTIRLLLDAEAKFRSNDQKPHPAPLVPRTSSTPKPCPTFSSPAMLCTNTRGELPIHFACMRNECARTIRLLAEADPRAALVRDASGKTPLRWLWIRFVDGLLDRFGGRDTQRENDGADLAFREQEGGDTPNFPSPGSSVLGVVSHGRRLSFDDAFNGGRSYSVNANIESDAMFVFDTEYIRRTRNIDRTVDFLRMRHVPSGFVNIEYVAAEHAITVLLKLKYLQERRNLQIEAYHSARSSGSNGLLPPDVSMSTKEEFILYAFEKFTSLIYAALIATEADERIDSMDAAAETRSRTNDYAGDNFSKTPPWKKLWHSLPQVESKKRFFLVHEACRSAANPAAVAMICIKLFSDQLFHQDDDGQLPLHKVACRGLGWEPLGSDIDASDACLADETLTLLREVLRESHEEAPRVHDKNKQLPLHCAVDSLVTSLVMGKERRASLHAEAKVALQKHRHTHVEIAIQCLSDLLQANSSALQRRDGKTGLFPFMQAATPHINDYPIIKYASDLSRQTGFDVGVSFHSMESEVVEEDEVEAESDHLTIIYYLLREDPSVISGLC